MDHNERNDESTDERCCGTGTCIINAQGLCWCGQQWDGQTMCRPALPEHTAPHGSASSSHFDNATAKKSA